MPHKRIIVEGPDGSGKSTLIRSILNTFPDRVHFVDGFKHSNFEFYQDWLVDQLFSPVPPTVPVHNRLFYSELVYGPILRQRIDLPEKKIASYKEWLREHAFLIYCNLSYEDLVKFAVENEQMDGVLANLRKIYHAYDDLMGEELAKYWITGRGLSYSFKHDRLSTVLQQVGDYLEH